MSYVIALLAGILAGLAYAAMRVRSPAPPLLALLGLLGMYLSPHLLGGPW